MTERPLRIGIVGLGYAGLQTLNRLRGRDDFIVTGVADAQEQSRVAAGVDISGFAALTELLDQAAVDCVYLATPTRLHAEHVIACLDAGVHVLVEKPIAASIQEARLLCDLALERQLTLLVCHARSVDPAVLAMKEIMNSGVLGKPKIISSLHYSDWVYKPRRPDELATELGGGVVFRQGSHHFDVLRGLVGPAKSVSGRVFDWDSRRPVVGAFMATVEYGSGVMATLTFSGYGGLDSREFTHSVGVDGEVADDLHVGRSRGAIRRLHDAGLSEADLKVTTAVSAGTHRPDDGVVTAASPVYGLTVVSCEGGDLRQSRNGVLVYSEEGVRELEVPPGDGTDAILTEFRDSIRGLRAPAHSGAWGLAVLELCAAVHQSSNTGVPVNLVHQQG